jgi:hypothetical protein
MSVINVGLGSVNSVLFSELLFMVLELIGAFHMQWEMRCRFNFKRIHVARVKLLMCVNKYIRIIRNSAPTSVFTGINFHLLWVEIH